MATQDGAKRMRPAAEETEEAPETAGSPVPSQMSLEDLGLSARVVYVLADASLETAQDILDTLAQGEARFLAIPGVGDKTLEEVRRQLAEKGLLELEDEPVVVERELQASGETEKATGEPERAPAGASKGAEDGAENAERPPAAPEQGAEQRVSFVVRLTIDEQGQPRRTEIEHAKSGRKETFPALDVQRLVTFMEACISPQVAPEPSTPPAPPPASVETSQPEHVEPATRLNTFDVQVFRTGAPGVAALVFRPDDSLVVQARFRLKGPEAASLTAQGSSFEVQVYAHEVASGTSRWLGSCTADLVEKAMEYTARIQVAPLSPGLYRLVTLVTLQAPTRTMVGHHEGPVVHVAGLRQRTPDLTVVLT